MLAKELQVSRHQISYLINKEYNTNFNAYINELRIDHCLRSLTPDHWRTYTLEAIADQSGFGSRGTFIKAFKRKTGVLPSEYRKTILAG
jgi:AraC-like DNA-binding protein